MWDPTISAFGYWLKTCGCSFWGMSLKVFPYPPTSHQLCILTSKDPLFAQPQFHSWKIYSPLALVTFFSLSFPNPFILQILNILLLRWPFWLASLKPKYLPTQLRGPFSPSSHAHFGILGLTKPLPGARVKLGSHSGAENLEFAWVVWWFIMSNTSGYLKPGLSIHRPLCLSASHSHLSGVSFEL